jgi:carbon-monoxide dehydrogenase medium subunit
VSHLRPFAYVEAQTIDEAIDALGAAEDPRLIAGGTVVVPTMKHGLIRPDVLVSIQRLPELAAIDDEDGAVRIGALATHRRVAASELVRSRAPALAYACGRVASPVIRSMGTLGGNLCYGESASDPSPVLLALDAQLLSRGSAGDRVIPVRSFFLGFYETALERDEIVTAIEVPPLPERARWSYMKWSPRAHEDKPLIGLAIVLQITDGVCRDARLAVGGVADRPVRLTAAGDALTGREPTPGAIADAAEAAAGEVEPIDDHQASASYRREMLRLWVARNLHTLAGVA